MPILLAVLLLYVSTPVEGQPRKGYRKATEGQAVVLRKLFPKKKRIEINANFGGILNQSFVDTMMVHGGISYHFSEAWGLALEGAMALNTDRSERLCIESFYNDFRPAKQDKDLTYKCYNPEGGGGKATELGSTVNIGPAYMPITEIDKLLALSAIWSPVYGKQIFSFLPRTSHMDIFLSMGGGIAMSTFYRFSNTLRNGRLSRVGQPEGTPEEQMQKHGAAVQEKNQWGMAGRPDAEPQTKPFISVSVGQKYHFLKHLFIKAELRNFTLLATEQGYHNFFAIWGGLGLRL